MQSSTVAALQTTSRALKQYGRAFPLLCAVPPKHNTPYRHRRCCQCGRSSYASSTCICYFVTRCNDGLLQDDANDFASDLDAEYDLRDGQVDMGDLEEELEAIMSDNPPTSGDGEEMLAEPPHSGEAVPLLSAQYTPQPAMPKIGGPIASDISMNGDARERNSHSARDSLLLSMQ